MTGDLITLKEDTLTKLMDKAYGYGYATAKAEYKAEDTLKKMKQVNPDGSV